MRRCVTKVKSREKYNCKAVLCVESEAKKLEIIILVIENIRIGGNAF